MDRIAFIIDRLKEARRVAAASPDGEMVVYLIDLAIVEAEEEQSRRAEEDYGSASAG